MESNNIINESDNEKIIINMDKVTNFNDNPVAIFYIGEPRYQKETKDNHEMFFKKLKENNIIFNLYDFTSVKRTHNNPAKSQVYNFFNALDRTKKDKNEQIVVKLRTDVYFPEKIMGNIIESLKSVLKGDINVCYLGRLWDKTTLKFEVKSLHYYKNHKLEKKTKITDWVVICNRKYIIKKRLFDKIMKDFTKNTKKEPKNGNLVWSLILKSYEKAIWINCLMYLVRYKFKSKNYPNQNNFTENQIIYFYHYCNLGKKDKKWRLPNSIKIMDNIMPNGPHKKKI